jgi:hypothetical protein
MMCCSRKTNLITEIKLNVNLNLSPLSQVQSEMRTYPTPEQIVSQDAASTRWYLCGDNFWDTLLSKFEQPPFMRKFIADEKTKKWGCSNSRCTLATKEDAELIKEIGRMELEEKERMLNGVKNDTRVDIQLGTRAVEVSADGKTSSSSKPLKPFPKGITPAYYYPGESSLAFGIGNSGSGIPLHRHGPALLEVTHGKEII